jgi:hypothetical protein
MRYFVRFTTGIAAAISLATAFSLSWSAPAQAQFGLSSITKSFSISGSEGSSRGSTTINRADLIYLGNGVIELINEGTCGKKNPRLSRYDFSYEVAVSGSRTAWRTYPRRYPKAHRSLTWRYRDIIRVMSSEEIRRAKSQGFSRIRKQIQFKQVCKRHSGSRNQFIDSRYRTAVTSYDVLIPIQ